MLKKEVRQYLAMIGQRGGTAGRGASKVRGTAAYYKRISKLAAKARAARRNQE